LSLGYTLLLRHRLIKEVWDMLLFNLEREYSIPSHASISCYFDLNYFILLIYSDDSQRTYTRTYTRTYARTYNKNLELVYIAIVYCVLWYFSYLFYFFFIYFWFISIVYSINKDRRIYYIYIPDVNI